MKTILISGGIIASLVLVIILVNRSNETVTVTANSNAPSHLNQPDTDSKQDMSDTAIQPGKIETTSDIQLHGTLAAGQGKGKALISVKDSQQRYIQQHAIIKNDITLAAVYQDHVVLQTTIGQQRLYISAKASSGLTADYDPNLEPGQRRDFHDNPAEADATATLDGDSDKPVDNTLQSGQSRQFTSVPQPDPDRDPDTALTDIKDSPGSDTLEQGQQRSFHTLPVNPQENLVD